MSHADVNGLSLYYEICAAPGLLPAVVPFLDAPPASAARQPSLSGSAATTTVPRPGGLTSDSVPPAASARSRRPRMPVPLVVSAPPRPSSATSQRSTPPSRRTDTLRAGRPPRAWRRW